ncbi:MAG TPA: hypothetical protein VFX43_20020 [Chitinophagaceae bacterium]|nr:hypothetical protein [Chitinophagaceae bacterium]
MISALKSKGIKTLKQRSQFYEPLVLALHGMGPGSIVRLKSTLAAGRLQFKTDAEKR